MCVHGTFDNKIDSVFGPPQTARTNGTRFLRSRKETWCTLLPRNGTCRCQGPPKPPASMDFLSSTSTNFGKADCGPGKSKTRILPVLTIRSSASSSPVPCAAQARPTTSASRPSPTCATKSFFYCALPGRYIFPVFHYPSDCCMPRRMEVQTTFRERDDCVSLHSLVFFDQTFWKGRIFLVNPVSVLKFHQLPLRTLIPKQTVDPFLERSCLKQNRRIHTEPFFSVNNLQYWTASSTYRTTSRST